MSSDLCVSVDVFKCPPIRSLRVNNTCLFVDVFVCLSAEIALKLFSRRRRKKILDTVRDLCKKHVFSIKVLHSK